MTRTLRRPAALALAGSLAALVLAGCGNSPVRSGAAATVGDTRISTSQLAGLVKRGLRDPQAAQQNADKDKFQRESLSRLIRHQILLEASRKEHIAATSGEVDAKIASFEQQAGGHAQLIQQAAQGGVAEQDLRAFVSDLVLQDVIGDKLTEDLEVPPAQLEDLYKQNAAQYDQVHSAHILVASKAKADEILAAVTSDPSQFAKLAAANSIDTSNKDKGGDLGYAGRGQFVKEFEAAVFAAKPGDFLEVKTQFGYHVVHVIDRRTTTLEQATPDLRRGVLQQQRQARTSALLSALAKRLHVKVNPRFGRWDSAQLQVLPASSKDAVSSPAPSPGDDGGAGQQPAPGTQPGGQPGAGAPPPPSP